MGNEHILWQEAADGLRRQGYKFKHLKPDNTIVLLDDVLRLVKEKKLESERKSLRIPTPRGNVLVVREIFEKVADFLQKFREVGDIAVQYDPGHAALPWAGIRLLLQMAINTGQKYRAMIEGLELATQKIAYFAIFEKMYLRRTYEATSDLQKSIIKSYTAILEFFDQAIDFLSEGRAERLLKGPTNVSENELDGFKNKVEIACREVERQRVLCDAEIHEIQSGMIASISADVRQLSVEGKTSKEQERRLQAICTDIESSTQRLSEQFREVQDYLDQQKRKEYADSLSRINHPQHHQNKDKALPGTCEWLFVQDNYKNWRSATASSLVYLIGDPGTGKSTLTAQVVNQVRKEQRNGIPFAYFYCTRNTNERERADPNEVLRSILRQIAWPKANEPIRKLVHAKLQELEDSGESGRKLNITETLDLIIALIGQSKGTIIIDALDEVDEEKIDDLLNSLQQIVDESNSIVKIFVSTRKRPRILRTPEQYPELEIKASDNEEDIRKLVETKIDTAHSSRKLLRGRGRPETIALIKNELVSRAQGMFLWVTLALDQICKVKFDRDIATELRRLPPRLEIWHRIYDDIQSLPRTERQIAMASLQWMACLETPIQTEEFVKAIELLVSEDILQEDLIDYCYNFIAVDTAQNVFRFSHQTAREHLVQEYPSIFDPESENSAAHATVAECCIKAALARNDGYNVLSSDELDLLEYAYVFWPLHLQKAGQLGLPTSSLGHQTSLFLMQDLAGDGLLAFQHWHREHYLIPFRRNLDDGIWTSASSHYRKLHYSHCVVGEEHPIFVACAFDIYWMVESFSSDPLVLDFLNHSSRIPPLSVAATFGNVRSVEVLLRAGADPKHVSGYPPTALAAAFAADPGSQQVAELVLAAMATEDIDQDVLAQAASSNSIDFMELVLDRCPTLTVDKDVLQAAAQQGSLEYFRYLCERATVDAIDKDVVEAAASNPLHSKILLQELLEHQGEVGQNILRTVAEYGNVEVVEYLLAIEGKSLTVDESVLFRAATNMDCAGPVIRYLLPRSAPESITHAVVNQMLWNDRQALEGLTVLLKENPMLPLTPGIMQQAASSSTASESDIIRFLFSQRGSLTSDILAFAASNWMKGDILSKYILSTGEANVTSAVLAAVASNAVVGTRILPLLSKHGKLKVTQRALENAASSGSSKMVEFLLGIGHDTPVSLRILRYASGRANILKTLLSHGIQWDPLALRTIICDCALIEDAFQIIGPETYPDEVNTELYYAALRSAHPRTIRFIFKTHFDPPELIELLYFAALFSNITAYEYIWSLLDLDIGNRLGTEVLVRAVQNRHSGKRIIHHILHSGRAPNIQVEGWSKILRLAARNKEFSSSITQALCNHYNELAVVQADLLEIIEYVQEPQVIYKMLQKRNPELDFKSKDFIMALVCNPGRNPAAIKMMSEHNVAVDRDFVDRVLRNPRGSASRHIIDSGFPLTAEDVVALVSTLSGFAVYRLLDRWNMDLLLQPSVLDAMSLHKSRWDKIFAFEEKIFPIENRERLLRRVYLIQAIFGFRSWYEPEKVTADELRAANWHGSTILMRATKYDRLEIIQDVLERAPDQINLGGLFQRTPLWYAARMGLDDIVALLLEHGAETDVVDKKTDMTPAEVAEYNGYLRIGKVIREWKAKAPVEERSDVGA